jgi:FKBP-type peptidyl-prolyl cis-trans isomerase 2
MSQTKALVALGILLVLVVSSSGCTTPDMNSLNPWYKKPVNKLEITIIGKTIVVQKGFNFTFAAVIRNLSDATYNATFSLGKLPKGFTGTIMNTGDHMLLPARSIGTIVRIYIGLNADTGTTSVSVKGVFKEKTSYSASTSIKVTVAAPSTGSVKANDDVDVDYIGFLDDGTIFDTSVSDIGINTNIPKAKEWTSHGTTYSPLTVILDTGGVIKGFNDGIKTLELGQSRTVLVTPDIGYAKYLNVTINRTQHIEMVQTLTWNDFVGLFDETPAENKVVTDKFWGWSVQVIDMVGNNATVMINPQPFINKTVHPYGFDSKIVAINSQANNGKGDIEVTNTPVTGVNVTYKGMPGKITKTTDTSLIITYNGDSNSLAQKNLWFEITLAKIHLA